LGFHLFQEDIETFVAGFPERAIGFGPVCHLADGSRLEGADVFAAAAFFCDEAGVFEIGQVLGDGLLGDGERFGELADGGGGLRQAVQNGAAGGVAECSEGLA